MKLGVRDYAGHVLDLISWVGMEAALSLIVVVSILLFDLSNRSNIPRYSRGMLVFNYVTPTETALRLVPSVQQRGAAAESTRIYYFPRYFTRSQ
jgi:uncharacterized protein with NRDE domain